MLPPRKVRAAVAASLLIGCTLALTASPALSAAPPAGYMHAPPSAYGEVDTDLLFTGVDPYNGYDKLLEIEGPTPPPTAITGPARPTGTSAPPAAPAPDAPPCSSRSTTVC